VIYLSKLVFFLSPQDGHFNPIRPIIRQLAQKHAVICYSYEHYKEKFNGLDIEFRAIRDTYDFSTYEYNSNTFEFICNVAKSVDKIVSEHLEEVRIENPDMISQTVLNKGLDSGTAFEILSIDIADVDVGRNIGAQLQTFQAEADKNIAQAKAEERRAMAVAKEQEMKALVQEMRARVVEAEAEVPKAMASALTNGKMGVMDYYNMQNIISDTHMRDSISKVNKPEGTDKIGDK
jgi:hypothetical protein